MTVRFHRLAMGAFVLASAACENAGPSTASPPPSTPARLPALSLEFADDSIRVLEGESAEIELRWVTHDLPNAVELPLVAQNRTTDDADYEILPASVTVPAGAGVSGAAAIHLTASADLHVAEGAEIVELRLASPEGVWTQLGPDLEVTISDAPARPCSGVEVLASPIAPAPGLGWIHTVLELAFGDVGGAWIEPIGPLTRVSDDIAPVSLLNITDWRIHYGRDRLLHTLEVEWPLELAARFGFDTWVTGGCSTPLLECDTSGCTLTP